jgi:hypothetical protein
MKNIILKQVAIVGLLWATSSSAVTLECSFPEIHRDTYNVPPMNYTWEISKEKGWVTTEFDYHTDSHIWGDGGYVISRVDGSAVNTLQGVVIAQGQCKKVTANVVKF